MLPDLRFAARLLSKYPLFSIAVIGLLALGIAANTVIFSVVDALLLRPLPVRAPERLVRPVTIRPPLAAYSEFTYEEYETWKKHVSGFEDLFAWSEQDMFVGVGETVERSRIHFVTDNFFTALGVVPLAGRLLAKEDDHPEHDRDSSGGAELSILAAEIRGRSSCGGPHGHARRTQTHDRGCLGARLQWPDCGDHSGLARSGRVAADDPPEPVREHHLL